MLALALSDSSSTNVTNLFDESLVLATPIALGAMTGLWCERSGIINIGIEGMMLAAAGVGFMAFAVLGRRQQPAGCGSRSCRHPHRRGAGRAACRALDQLRINQIVSGVVINLFALGLTGFLRSEVIVPSGNSKGISTAEFGIPLLERSRSSARRFFQGKPLHYAMYCVVFLTWLVMFRTAWGLRVGRVVRIPTPPRPSAST